MIAFARGARTGLLMIWILVWHRRRSTRPGAVMPVPLPGSGGSQQRRVLGGKLDCDVDELLVRDRLAQRGEHGPGVLLGLERQRHVLLERKAFALRDPAQELLQRHALG